MAGDRCLRRGNCRLALGNGGAVVAVVDREERLARLDPVAGHDGSPPAPGLTPRPKLRVIRCDSWVTGTLCVVEMSVAVKDARRCHFDVDAARGLLLLPSAAVANRDRSDLARRNAGFRSMDCRRHNERPRSGVIQKTYAHREFYRH